MRIFRKGECRVGTLAPHLAPIPPDAPNDFHFVGGAVIGAVLLIIGYDACAGWIAHRDELEPLGYEPHSVVQNKNAWWVWAALCHVYQDNVAILQRRDHAVALNGQDAQQGGGGLQALTDPGAAEVEIPPYPIFIFNDCAAAH